MVHRKRNLVGWNWTHVWALGGFYADLFTLWGAPRSITSIKALCGVRYHLIIWLAYNGDQLKGVAGLPPDWGCEAGVC